MSTSQMSFPRESLERIKWWMDIASGNLPLPVEFTHFIAIWEAFNAWARCWWWLKGCNDDIGDRALIRKVGNDRAIQAHYSCLLSSNHTYLQTVQTLKDKCPVYDVRCVQTERTHPIDDISNLSEVLDVLYAIRCNLFHGGKGNTCRDLELSSLAFEVLFPLLTVLKDDSSITRT